MTSPDIFKLVEDLKAVTASPLVQDPKLRKSLYHATLGLSWAVEAPLDTMKRVVCAPMELSVVQTAVYMQIFATLAGKEAPCTTAELAAPTRADLIFTGRILRYLASHGFVSEASRDLYQANTITKSLSTEGCRASISSSYHFTTPAVLASPEFFAQTHFQNPSSLTHTPFQAANKTDQPAFAWLHGNPALVADFDLCMKVLREGQRVWLDVIDFAAFVGTADDRTPVFVDVGGSIGSQCALLRARLPALRGRVILQDLEPTIAHALRTEGVENMVCDFLKEQPLKGARAYYFRTVLHDWPDAKCLDILAHTKAATGPESVILIDELIIPDTGAHAQATAMDIGMMSTFGSMERTRTQWDALLAAAGLDCIRREVYEEDNDVRIQMVVPKGRGR